MFFGDRANVQRCPDKKKFLLHFFKIILVGHPPKPGSSPGARLCWMLVFGFSYARASAATFLTAFAFAAGAFAAGAFAVVNF